MFEIRRNSLPAGVYGMKFGEFISEKLQLMMETPELPK